MKKNPKPNTRVLMIGTSIDGDKIVNHVRIETREDDLLSVFVAQRPYGAKRDYLLHKLHVPNQHWETTIESSFALVNGARLWVESMHPVLAKVACELKNGGLITDAFA